MYICFTLRVQLSFLQVRSKPHPVTTEVERREQIWKKIFVFGLNCFECEIWMSLELVLKEEQVVSGGDCNDVLGRMPGSVQDLLVEVQTVDVDLVLNDVTHKNKI